MKRFLSFFHPRLPIILIYMLQQVEYDPRKFLSWILKLPLITSVKRRQQLVMTTKARLLVAYTYLLWLWYITLSASVGLNSPLSGLTLLLLSPFMVSFVLYLTVLLAWLWIEEPKRNRELRQARKIFKKHTGIKVAILGSYGKTTMKELLSSVLSSKKSVAATPGNKNVPISHARWAHSVSGQEDILLLEYGEGEPGDIKRLAELSQPNMAVITGLAPNHLDRYKSLDEVAEDLFSIEKFVPGDNVYINGDGSFEGYDISRFQKYDLDKVMGWKIGNIKLDYDATTFTMRSGKKRLNIKSHLIGRHQTPVLALAAALAERLGVSHEHIEKSLKQSKPFEHRMEPRLVNGAWIIDDTYNGNLEGIKAGLQLLEELPAKRKVYVTPGLVDQGRETERVHREIGVAITKANPDLVVLVQNSVIDFISSGLTAGGYGGLIEIINNPLEFYTNLEHRLAHGDLWLLQNDWTDNYS